MLTSVGEDETVENTSEQAQATGTQTTEAQAAGKES